MKSENNNIIADYGRNPLYTTKDDMLRDKEIRKKITEEYAEKMSHASVFQKLLLWLKREEEIRNKTDIPKTAV